MVEGYDQISGKWVMICPICGYQSVGKARAVEMPKVEEKEEKIELKRVEVRERAFRVSISRKWLAVGAVGIVAVLLLAVPSLRQFVASLWPKGAPSGGGGQPSGGEQGEEVTNPFEAPFVELNRALSTRNAGKIYNVFSRNVQAFHELADVENFLSKIGGRRIEVELVQIRRSAQRCFCNVSVSIDNAASVQPVELVFEGGSWKIDNWIEDFIRL
jgi:hypothetical protein